MALIWIESPILIPSRSTVIFSVMAVAGTAVRLRSAQR